MRIGELAALLGVSTRTVRHYHHQGVLPEPARRANGYREYGMRDAIALARVRRLVQLGLSLDEVRDVVSDDRTRELPEILAEIDADLARQEREIHVRRARIAELIGKAQTGALGPDDTVSAELAAYLQLVDVPRSRAAAWDRDLLTLVDSVGRADAGEPSWATFAALVADPELVERGNDFYRRLDELADADPADPRVADLAATLTGFATEHLLNDDAPDLAGWDAEAVEPFLDELAPAQAEVVRQAVRRISEHVSAAATSRREDRRTRPETGGPSPASAGAPAP
ncbi:MerR family transcriptional regulator [Nonomuraea indica]|uniref:MerR family transcriptional regulator n=1 Tax=Nonomuraea indica TaxID=1581193 RepID=A0ABW8A8J9_9ACTN|nr:MerR family transcriptional regulator [Nonomuraea indica]